MISPATTPSTTMPVSAPRVRTVWGLDPEQLHTRYWASMGVQVVRIGEPSAVVRHADLYLLTDPRTLPVFRLSDVMETLQWIEPTVLILLLRDGRESGYREHVICDHDDQFLRFRRTYDRAVERQGRAALTSDREIAQLWQQAGDPLKGWRRIRRFVPRQERATVKVQASAYDRVDDAEVARMMHDLVRRWRRPHATIERARPVWVRRFGTAGDARKPRGATDKLKDVWADLTAVVEGGTVVGPLWIGAGRRIQAGGRVVGPAILWDDDEARPTGRDVSEISWLAIEPGKESEFVPPPGVSSGQGRIDRVAKRSFDLLFSAVVLGVSLPLWPLIMFAIWWEDGRPFFFGHERQTLGGKPFRCWKFRSMFRNAESIKKRLIDEGRNQADGAQFYMDDDPRITRTGRFLRKTNLDELPQFWNVLVGDMSVVGPRPSPDRENQYSPSWREARLSVKPGITGLWQIRRTRQAGNDFQEWIRFDIAYVENRSFWLDLWIVWKTVTMILSKVLRS